MQIMRFTLRYLLVEVALALAFVRSVNAASDPGWYMMGFLLGPAISAATIGGLVGPRGMQVGAKCGLVAVIAFLLLLCASAALVPTIR